MGIDVNGAQLLIRAHKSGVSFHRVATLGRQGLHGDRQALIAALRESGYEMSTGCVRSLLDPKTAYCDDFLRLLGAREIVAIDMSDFEGAQIVHDMNQPIPDGLVSSFDVVLDGGTLEHVFDFPTALRNATRMVRPDGRFISITMANNFCGHGFYQFSPELFYRFLCMANGYAMECCILWEDIPGSEFFLVPDPNSVRSRINLTSESGMYMLIQARRLGEISGAFIPQQSDYAHLWEAQLGEAALRSLAAQRSHGLMRAALKRIPALRSAVTMFRKLLRSQSREAAAEYRNRRVKRNVRGHLKPMNELRVMG